MPAPRQVAAYLYAVTFIPAASAVEGFSPTARRLSPTRVRFITKLRMIAHMIAKYTMNPNDENSSPMCANPTEESPGIGVLNAELVTDVEI